MRLTLSLVYRMALAALWSRCLAGTVVRGIIQPSAEINVLLLLKKHTSPVLRIHRFTVAKVDFFFSFFTPLGVIFSGLSVRVSWSLLLGRSLHILCMRMSVYKNVFGYIGFSYLVTVTFDVQDRFLKELVHCERLMEMDEFLFPEHLDNLLLM